MRMHKKRKLINLKIKIPYKWILYQCKIWPMNSRTILNRISSVYNRARKGLDAIFLINLNMNMSFIRCTTMALTLFSLIMQKLD